MRGEVYPGIYFRRMTLERTERSGETVLGADALVWRSGRAGLMAPALRQARHSEVSSVLSARSTYTMKQRGSQQEGPVHSVLPEYQQAGEGDPRRWCCPSTRVFGRGGVGAQAFGFPRAGNGLTGG